MKQTISIWLKASFALFAVSVVGAGIAALSLASYEPGSQERCDQLGKIVYSGQATATDKDEYYKYCVEQPTAVPATTAGSQSANPTLTCDELKKLVDSGMATSDQKDLWTKCQQGTGVQPSDTESQAQDLASECQDLMYTIKKYSADPNSSDYLEAKAKYDSLCANNPTPSTTASDCEELRAKLEKLSADPSSQDYADTKAEYVQLCSAEELKLQAQETEKPETPDASYAPESKDCKDLREKIAEAGDTAQTDPQEIADLKATFEKQCSKPTTVPPAGFEDVVLTNPTDYSNPFPDTNINDRQGKAAAELYRRGVIGGFADGEFKGGNPVNRAEAAKFLLLACAKETQANYSGKFRDLLKGQWYVPFVEAAAEQGIINGYPDGTFHPADTVNRAEFSKMITLACQLPTNLDHSLFTDVKDADWFAMYAGAVQKYSLYPDSVVDNLFKPANLMTRSEVAIAIYQYLTNR